MTLNEIMIVCKKHIIYAKLFSTSNIQSVYKILNMKVCQLLNLNVSHEMFIVLAKFCIYDVIARVNELQIDWNRE